MTKQERQWRHEERQEQQEASRQADLHRSDCLCRAVREWAPGPNCYQKVTT